MNSSKQAFKNPKKVLETNEKQLEDRKQAFLEKFQKADEKVVETQKSKTEGLKHRHVMDIIKRKDRRENVERNMRKQQYNRDKLAERLEMNRLRAESIRLIIIHLRPINYQLFTLFKFTERKSFGDAEGN
jgi:hypothetical protein